MHVVLRDVKSAFDKVWHLRLRMKLLNLQLPPRFVNLLSSFLENRTARVVVGSHSGNPISIMAGVSQGAILSPTLCNIFVSDIPVPRRRDLLDIIFADRGR